MHNMDENTEWEGWDEFTEEELLDNGDYMDEIRFGGDPSSDRMIREAVFAQMRDDDDFPNDYDY